MHKKRKIIKVGTFNLLNLALANRSFYGHQSYSTQEYEQKKAWVKQQLLKMDADIIGFQEVFDVAALQAVIDKL